MNANQPSTALLVRLSAVMLTVILAAGGGIAGTPAHAATVVPAASTTMFTPASTASRKACEAAIKKRPIYTPVGLTIMCVPAGDKRLHGNDAYSVSYLNSEQVWIQNSSSKYLNELVAHEFAHGFAWQVMTPALRQQFATSLKKKEWGSGTYYQRPSEVWAYNMGRCQGYLLNTKPTKVDCKVIAKYEAAAKAAHTARVPRTLHW